MPNWCFTNYVVEGDKEEIADLMQKLESLEKQDVPLVENGFGKNFLGNVVALFGGDRKKINCRGEFMNLERTSEATLQFNTETAWGDMPEVWDSVCGKYKSLKYYFLAEETGNGYYATNDAEGKYFPDRFIIDQWETGSEYCETEQSLFAGVGKRTGTAVTGREEMQSAIDSYNAQNEENEIYVHEIEIIE
ncbi:hypothetical protein [Viscerimonas tarda]